MGHGKSDRLHLTQAEHSGMHGNVSSNAGAQAKLNSSQYEPIPFTSCSLSLQDWELPMADPNSGTIFELTNIVPWLKKYGNQNPVDGSKLELKDLVRLNFDKDEQGKLERSSQFQDEPLDVEILQHRKAEILFTPHSHIVALRPTGNVFSFETVSELNLKTKSLRDLLDDTPFTKKDIITLQDPHNMSSIKDMNQLNHLKKGMKLTDSDRRAPKADSTSQSEFDQHKEEDEANINATGSASKILNSMKKTKEEKEAKEKAEAGFSSKFPGKPRVPHNQTSISSNRAAASFTSSSLTPVTKTERILRDEEDLMLEEVSKKKSAGKGKAKAYVRLTTNFGPLNLELHVDTAPKTVYNFLTLCKQGKYNDTIFHRNIKGFMIQGGDPTGTGKGGVSMWGGKFEDELDKPGSHKHAARGTLSMANSGPETNGSQFFITYRPTPHLDSKHTVFGRVVNDNDTVLSNLESIPTDSNDKPLRSIKILDVGVFDDPFDTYKEGLKKKLERENMSEAEKKIRDEKRRKKEEDRTTWLGTNLSKDDSEVLVPAVGLLGSASGIGKYVSSSSTTSSASSIQPSTQKRKTPSQANLASASTSSADSHSFGGMPSSNKKKKSAGGFGDFSSW